MRVEVRTYSGYTFRSYGRYKAPGGYFEMLRGGRRIYSRNGGDFMVALQERTGKPLMGRDITGDGQPDLAVSEFGRGAHGPYFAYVFQIGKKFRHIATIDGEHDWVRFDDADKDGKIEALIMDWTFAYWNASFADSPAPKVILRYKKGQYAPAPELMRKPVPPSSVLKKRIEEAAAGLRKIKEYLNDDPYGQAPSILWGTMLDLMYSGHADVARAFFDQAWPEGVPGKQRFLSDFRGQLAKSPYWSVIRARNEDGI